MSTSSSLSISALFQRALSSASSASQLPTLDPESQSSLQSALADLSLLVSRVKALSLFSDNETADDLATKDIIYTLVEFVWAEAVGRVSAVEREDRMANLRESERHLRAFLQTVKDYDLIPAAELNLFAPSRSVADPQARRALKIQQFKSEQALRGSITTLLPAPFSPASDFELYSAPLSLPSTHSEENTRRLSFALVRLAHIQAQAQLKSIGDELVLLQSAPPEPPTPAGNGEVMDGQDDTWRLDQIRQSLTDHNGPLLDPQGRPLRPFTILPSNSGSSGSVAADRQRLAAQVFRPDHRLPSMTIDEYLAEEQRRGNIISGGGAASQNAPTSSEILQQDTEEDGTAFAESREEEKRKKEEDWAVWTEANPKGAGNRGNKG